MEILMPQLGETVTEGKITVWFKSVGDSVAPGDNFLKSRRTKFPWKCLLLPPAYSGKSE